MVEVRKEFEWLAQNADLTPYDYAVSILGHDFMDVTSRAKMKTAEFLYYYGGSIRQTRSFDTNLRFYETNMEATVELVNKIDDFEPVGERTKYHLAEDVSTQYILDFYKNIKRVLAQLLLIRKILEFIQSKFPGAII
ncbi:hypothetical protein F3K44_33165 [Bacillus megaterium]|nr:hypothetical protein [Priestia megaterium]